MHVEVVTVCAGHYLEFFKETYPRNRELGTWIVGTSIHDKATSAYCAEQGIKCVAADPAAYQDVPLMRDFCKERLINAALGEAVQDGWVIHMDADMVVPVQPTRDAILRGDKRKLLYMDRYGCSRQSDWEQYKRTGNCELVKMTSGPWGYFQAVHPSGSQFAGVRRWYPEQWRSKQLHNDDALQRLFRARNLLCRLPLAGIHLGSGGCDQVTGRTSYHIPERTRGFWDMPEEIL